MEGVWGGSIPVDVLLPGTVAVGTRLAYCNDHSLVMHELGMHWTPANGADCDSCCALHRWLCLEVLPTCACIAAIPQPVALRKHLWIVDASPPPHVSPNPPNSTLSPDHPQVTPPPPQLCCAGKHTSVLSQRTVCVSSNIVGLDLVPVVHPITPCQSCNQSGVHRFMH